MPRKLKHPDELVYPHSFSINKKAHQNVHYYSQRYGRTQSSFVNSILGSIKKNTVEKLLGLPHKPDRVNTEEYISKYSPIINIHDFKMNGYGLILKYPSGIYYMYDDGDTRYYEEGLYVPLNCPYDDDSPLLSQWNKLRTLLSDKTGKNFNQVDNLFKRMKMYMSIDQRLAEVSEPGWTHVEVKYNWFIYSPFANLANFSNMPIKEAVFVFN